MDCFKLTSFDLNYLIFKYSDNLNIKSVYQKPFTSIIGLVSLWTSQEATDRVGSVQGLVGEGLKWRAVQGLAPGFTTFTVSLVFPGWLVVSTCRH